MRRMQTREGPLNQLKIAPVVKLPIEVRATTALRESIVGGAIAAGERITEIQISQQMNLSRATVRTALHQLAKEGLLKQVPYTGWSVVSLSARDVWELYTLRSAVERLAARLAATDITPAKVAQLDAAFDRLAQECRRGKADRIAEADFALHKTIVDLAEHGRLASQYGLIEQQIRMYIRSSDALVPTPDEILEQHRPIYEAIRAGDADAAERRSERHNLSEGSKLKAHVEALPAAPAPAAAPVAQRRRRVAA